MADVNNALAAQIQVPQLDVAGTLQKAGTIKLLNTENELKQQEMGSRRLELQGRIGNVLSGAKSREDVQQAIQMSRDGGVPVDSLTEQHLLSVPLSQVNRYGSNMQQGGQSSTSAIEQTGIPAGNQTRESGKYLPEGLQPNVPYISRTQAATGGAQPTQDKVDNAIQTGRNFDGSPRVLSAADVVGSGPQTPSFNDRFPNQSIFQPRVVRGPGGSISSSVTPETQGLQGSAVERFKQMQDTAGKAQDLMGQLDAIEHENDVLNSSGWSSTGAGANAKINAAKSINSMFQTFGMAPPIDPTKVANWEGYNKQTFRAGADFARTLGGHQAESIIQGSISATPNVENTYFGSKIITNAIRQTVQRQVDMYRFSLDYARQNGGSTFGAEDAFNRQFPPKLYSQTAVANAIPKASIDRLTASGGDKTNRAQFDSVYGPGMSDFVLRNANGRQ